MPIISIIICTYNRAKILAECLNAICKQTEHPNAYKIIVIDNNSSDKTALVVREFQNSYKNIEYFFEPAQGLSIARNRGAREAKTDWIGYLDDDGLAHPDFIEQVIATISNYNFDCFGGKYYPWYKGEKPKWLSEEFGKKQDLRDGIGEINSPHLDGGIFFIKRILLIKYGCFPINLGMQGKKIAYGEESRIQQRLLANQYKLGYNPNVAMNHLVSQKKLKVKWHLAHQYALGRDNNLRTSTINTQPIISTTLKLIFLQIRENLPKLLIKQYYVQNFIIDVSSPVLYFWGEKKASKTLGKHNVAYNANLYDSNN